MPLTTIDGVLCCPRSEFDQLCHYLGLQEYALTYGPRYISEDRADRELGAKTRYLHGENYSASYSPLSYAPDEWFVREVAKGVNPQAISSVKTKIGEEDLNGEIWPGPDADAPAFDPYWVDETGEKHRLANADLSLIGPASLGGKIVRELCYRLYVEVQKDKHAQQYAPHERIDQSVLQPDPLG